MGRKKVKLTCVYCKHYYQATIRNVEFKSSREIHSRICVIKNTFVKATDDSCEFFELSNFIFCKKDDNWVTPAICINRVDKKVCSKRCSQYKIIDGYINLQLGGLHV